MRCAPSRRSLERTRLAICPVGRGRPVNDRNGSELLGVSLPTVCRFLRIPRSVEVSERRAPSVSTHLTVSNRPLAHRGIEDFEAKASAERLGRSPPRQQSGEADSGEALTAESA